MADPDVRITEYTDPGCPWAYSAEPFRRRLNWLYGPRLEWRTVMVGLADAPAHYEEIGFTPDRQASAFRRIAHDHGMPIDTSVRPRMAATLPACRAVVATRLHAPDRERILLRRLRVRCFAGGLLDEDATLDGSALDALIEPVGPRARPQARQLVRRPPLHLPVLRGHAPVRRRHRRGPGLPAVGRLRRRAGEPRARARPP
jgi:hypothetical protein